MHNRRRITYVRWLLTALVATSLIYVFTAFPVGDWLKHELDKIARMGPLGYLWFTLLYILATVAGFPGSILTLGAGAAYGVLIGSVLVSVAATLGAAAAFLVGRYLARSVVERRVAPNPRFRAVDKAVGHKGFKIVFLTRLSPVFPFVLLNYMFGITRVKFSDYVLASFLGMIPGTILYVYLGSIAGSLATGTLPESPVRKVFTFAGLFVTLIVTLYVTKVARTALRGVEGPAS